jgi:DNA-binding NarL/FixJ family response regulator
LLRVLLVEDLKRTRSLMEDLFHSLGGFRVTGTTGTEAEAKLWLDERHGACDLVVVDLVLEQGSGLGVIERCRVRAPQAKVVVFSSYATPGVSAHCLRLGADAVFDKGEPSAFVAYCAGLVQTEAEPS